MKAIAAMSKNRVIGRKGIIPWFVPEDIKFFQRMTHDKAVVMGRKTYESIKGPLGGRFNIVATSLIGDQGDDDTVFVGGDLYKCLRHFPCQDKLFVIGGEQIYRQLLDHCTDLYLTTVDTEVRGGDAFFPEFDYSYESLVKKGCSGNLKYEIIRYSNPYARDKSE